MLYNKQCLLHSDTQMKTWEPKDERKVCQSWRPQERTIATFCSLPLHPAAILGGTLALCFFFFSLSLELILCASPKLETIPSDLFETSNHDGVGYNL